VKLVGTDISTIIENVNLLLKDKQIYNNMAQAHNPYGDGKACERIVKTLLSLGMKASLKMILKMSQKIE